MYIVYNEVKNTMGFIDVSKVHLHSTFFDSRVLTPTTFLNCTISNSLKNLTEQKYIYTFS